MSIIGGMTSWLRSSTAKSSFHLPPGVSLKTKICAILFARKRPDYYRFLADMIKATKGRMTLSDLFSNDKGRYKGKLRGHLAAHWEKQFHTYGGALKQTFDGTLPSEDVEMLSTLQNEGGAGAIENGLSDLAQNGEIVAKARSILIATLAAAFLSVGLLIVSVIGVPMYTAPMIKEAFSIVSPENYPESAVSLFGFADFVGSYWLLILFGCIGFIAFCMWSFFNLTGPVRIFLDKYGMAWAIHRDFQSLRFVTSLASMTKRRGDVAIGLRDALQHQLAGASRWKRHHVSRMVQMVKVGNTSSDIFKTGLLDIEIYYYLDDLIKSRGFDDALQFVRTRMEEKVISKITLQSLTLSWVLLLLSILWMSKLMFWHYTVVDDMRKALQFAAG